MGEITCKVTNKGLISKIKTAQAAQYQSKQRKPTNTYGGGTSTA